MLVATIMTVHWSLPSQNVNHFKNRKTTRIKYYLRLLVLLTGYNEAAQMLIDSGADINAVGNDGTYKIKLKW